MKGKKGFLLAEETLKIIIALISMSMTTIAMEYLFAHRGWMRILIIMSEGDGQGL